MGKKVGAKQGQIKTWQEAERAMEQWGRSSCALEEAQARLETELQAVRERHADALGDLEAELIILADDLRGFAKVQKAEFKPREAGGDVRSYEHAGVVLGYQRTPPFVRIRDEEKALKWLASEPWLKQFIRLRQEANREALRAKLSEGDQRLVERLAAHGITLDQKDKFFLEVTRG